MYIYIYVYIITSSNTKSNKERNHSFQPSQKSSQPSFRIFRVSDSKRSNHLAECFNSKGVVVSLRCASHAVCKVRAAWLRGIPICCKRSTWDEKLGRMLWAGKMGEEDFGGSNTSVMMALGLDKSN